MIKYFNKSGNSDLIYVMLTIIVLSIILPVYNLFMRYLGTGLSSSTNVTLASESATMLTNSYIASSDVIFATVFFALYIGAMILAYFLDTHPMFIISGIVVIIILSWIGIIFADSFYSISTASSALGLEIQTNFPMMLFIMHWFAEISISMMILVLIILYRKNTI